jgi:glutathione S-transferase
LNENGKLTITEDEMLELYHFYGATCGLKARLAVDEKQIAIIDHAVDRKYLRTPEYLKLNPNGVVPTLVHDGMVLTESSVIINYLDDLFEEHPLKPNTAIGAAHVLWWLKRADEYLADIGMLTYTVSMRPKLQQLGSDGLKGYFDGIPSATVRTRRKQIVESGLDNPDFPVALAGLRSMLAEMEDALTHSQWLAGDAYTLADLAMTPLLERLVEMHCDEMWRLERPNVCDWWSRISTRSSYQSCVVQKPNPEASQHGQYGHSAWPKIKRLFFT